MIIVELDLFWNGGSNTHHKENMCHHLFTENYGSTEMHLCSRHQVSAFTSGGGFTSGGKCSVSGVFSVAPG
jgi:hypothetical protein